VPLREPVDPIGKEIVESGYRWNRLFVLGLFVTLLICAGLFVRYCVAYDACLDQGGCWDSNENRCEFVD
jgi:hypothetical protein